MTDHVPMLSVIMGVYNREKYIAEAIESVLAQTFQDFELIIIDDGSTDSSLDIIRKYEQRDSRIIVIQLEVNSGQSTSRNTGIKKARGQFIAIVDSDDICMPERFEYQMNYLETNKSIDVLGSYYCIFQENHPEECDVVTAHVQDIYRGKPPVHNPTTMMRRDIFQTYGLYDSVFDDAEDYELWTRWFASGVKFANIEKVLYRKRNHPDCASNSAKKHQVHLMLRINFRLLFKYRISLAFRGYVRIIEQVVYLLYLSINTWHK